MNKKMLQAMFKEDIPNGDVTSEAIFGIQTSEARLISKQSGILCGISLFCEAMHHVDPQLEINMLLEDGDAVVAGMLIGKVKGQTRNILKAERVALNLFQHLSGIATRTNQYTSIVQGTNIKILDTRKTLPLYRDLQKYAVRIGGGVNHRFSLSDQAMIKDNHIQAAGSIKNAVMAVRASNPEIIIITECETFEHVKETLQTSTDVIMLDNMDNEMLAKACKIINGKKEIEVSGNMNLERVASLLELPIDRISIGELTHSVQVLDISLKF